MRLAVALLVIALLCSSEPSPPRCAFVTVVLSEDFVDCSLALVRSIRSTDTEHDVAALVLPEISASARQRLSEAGANHIAEIQAVENPNKVVRYQIFAKNYGILRAWQLSGLVGQIYEKAVYMDSDMVMTQNSDDLCLQPELSAARDLGGKPGDGEDAGHVPEFNAGLMVLEPSEATFQRLMAMAPDVSSPSGGVQPLLRAAFPSYNALDHLRDNVNARVHELKRGLWKLGKIRSIHYTGPVKPCFTSPQDSAHEPWDQPFRVWHRLSDGEALAKAPAVDGMPESFLSAREAWQAWFRPSEGSVLAAGFGLGEEELKVVPAHHVSKHGSAAMAQLAEQIFSAGFGQLLCRGGSCLDVQEISQELVRAVKQMQRTLKLFLQRASNDAEVDVMGLGSVSSILAAHADTAGEDIERTLRKIAVEQTAGPQHFVWDLTAALARRLRQQEELMRWHLSHALLILLWLQIRHLRAGGENVAMVPESFSLEVPEVKFEWICCRVWDVVAKLLQEGDLEVAVLADGPTSTGQLEALLPVLVPGVRLMVVEDHQAFVQAEPRGLVLVGCDSGQGHDDHHHEMEFGLVSDQLHRWQPVAALVAGCGFAASRPGIVEAVSQHALQVGMQIVLSSDAMWWLAPYTD